MSITAEKIAEAIWERYAARVRAQKGWAQRWELLSQGSKDEFIEDGKFILSLLQQGEPEGWRYIAAETGERRLGTAEALQFSDFRKLPEGVRKHFEEIEMFLSDVDGKDLATFTEDSALDEGTIDCENVVRAVNAIAAWVQSSSRQAVLEEKGGTPFGIIDPDYARVYTLARVVAWQEGYALTLHGSFTRDLDLVAVPWTDRACEPEHLAKRIEEATKLKNNGAPTKRPHDRLTWTLLFPEFGDPRFVDLSVFATTPQGGG